MLHLLVGHEDAHTLVVKPPSASSAAHLDVLAAGQPSVLVAVELLEVGKDDGSGGHVDSHGEGFGCEEYFYEAGLEEEFGYFFSYGE